MFSVEVFRDTLLRIASILQRLGIRFHVAGGAATIAYTQPRATQDIDLVLDPAQLRMHFDAFVSAVEQAGFSLHVPSVRDAITHARAFQLLDIEQVLRLDMYPRELIPGELDRSTSLEMFPGVNLPVVSQQDLILAKLIWVSQGSHRSRREVRWLWRGLPAETQRIVSDYAADQGLATLLNEVVTEPEEA